MDPPTVNRRAFLALLRASPSQTHGGNRLRSHEYDDVKCRMPKKAEATFLGTVSGGGEEHRRTFWLVPDVGRVFFYMTAERLGQLLVVGPEPDSAFLVDDECVKLTDVSTTFSSPATDAQIRYLRALVRDAGRTGQAKLDSAGGYARITKAAASELIGDLKNGGGEPPAPAGNWAPTAEQAEIVRLFKTGDSLKVYAGAGAGKTTTLRLCAEAQPDRQGLFVAFNRSIIEAAKQSMPRQSVDCRTMHSLAYRATDPVFIERMKSRSNRVHPTTIANKLGINQIGVRVPNPDGTEKPRTLVGGFLASHVLGAITRFCQTADDVPTRKHFARIDAIDAENVWDNNNAVARSLEKHLAVVWADILDPNGWLPFKPDHYLKSWALTRPVLSYDYIAVDEAQDLSGVMAGIVQTQLDAGIQVIAVGDTWQSINEWMNAINALEKLPISASAQLTKSFRFGPPVAAAANAILARLGTDFRIEGNDDVTSTVGPATSEVRCTLARTNAVAVELLLTDREEGGDPHLVGDAQGIVRFCEAAKELQAGVQTNHPELACFSSWLEVQDFCDQHEDGKDLKLMVRLIDKFGADTIISALQNMPSEAKATHIYSTAHKVKGREWNTVALAHDFPRDSEDVSAADLKLLYVAITRGKTHVDPSRVQCLTKVLAGLLTPVA